MFFTQDDYKKIQQWLIKNSVKDTEFNEANIPFKGNEVVSIVQGNQNKKVLLKDLVSQIFNLGVSDFVNITDKYNAPNINLEEAIRLIPLRARKEGQVITFLDEENHWYIYQFKGTLNQWNILEQWKDLFESIYNNSILPDEEDLTKSLPDENGNSYLSFKNKRHNKLDFSGLGKVYLRKNIINGVNTLLQKDINEANTIYIIQYDYDLNGETLTIPEGCLLDFQGGKISGGVLKGNFSVVDSTEYIFKDISFEKGNTYICCDYLRPEWFGAKGDWDWKTKTGTDDSDAFTRMFQQSDNCGVRKIKLSSKCYRIAKGVDIHYGDICIEGVFGLKREDTISYGHNERNTNLYSCMVCDGASSVINVLPDVSHPIHIKDVNFINITSKSIISNAINYTASFFGPTWPVIIEGCYFSGFHYCFYSNSSTQYNITWLIIRDNAFNGNDWCVYFEDHSPDENNISRNLAWAFEFYDNKAHNNACILRVCVVKDYCNIYNNNMEGNLSKFLDGTSTNDYYSIDVMTGLKSSLNIYGNHFEQMTHDTIKIYLINVVTASIYSNIRENDYSSYARVFIEGVSNSLRKSIQFKFIDWPVYVNGGIFSIENMSNRNIDVRLTERAKSILVLSNVQPELNKSDRKFHFMGNSKGIIVGDKVCSSINLPDRLLFSTNFDVPSGDYIMSIAFQAISDTKASDISFASLTNILLINSSGSLFGNWSSGAPRGYRYVIESKKVSVSENVTGNLLHAYAKKFTSGYKPSDYIGDVLFDVYEMNNSHNYASFSTVPSFSDLISLDTDTSLANIGTVKCLPDKLVKWTGTYWKNIIPQIVFSLNKYAYSDVNSINASTVNSLNGYIVETGNNVLGDTFKIGKLSKGVYTWKNQRLNIAEYTSDDYDGAHFSKILYTSNGTSDSFTINDEGKYYVAYSYISDINSNAKYDNPILMY